MGLPTSLQLVDVPVREVRPVKEEIALVLVLALVLALALALALVLVL